MLCQLPPGWIIDHNTGLHCSSSQPWSITLHVSSSPTTNQSLCKMHRHQHIKTQKHFLHCSLSFVENRQANIPGKYDEHLFCLLLFISQPVYLWDICALRFFHIQQQVNKEQDNQVVWGFRITSRTPKYWVLFIRFKGHMYVCEFLHMHLWMCVYLVPNGKK